LFRLCHEIEISNNHVKNFLYFFNKPIAHNAFRLCEFHALSARICKISKGRMHLQIDRTLRNRQNALHARSPKTQHIIWALPWVKPSREWNLACKRLNWFAKGRTHYMQTVHIMRSAVVRSLLNAKAKHIIRRRFVNTR